MSEPVNDPSNGGHVFNGTSEPLECLNENDECQGSVEYWSSGSSLKSWARCTFHGEKRIDQANDPNSMEMYADSDVAPSWFDPADAGETW